MAIDPQLANQAELNTPTMDSVEQLKAQAKIQMAQTTAELDDDSTNSASIQPTIQLVNHDPHSSAGSNDNSSSTPGVTSSPSAPAVTRSLPPPHIAKAIPCRFYAIGACKYGEGCAFSHALAPSTGAVTLLPGMSNGTPTSPNPIDSTDGSPSAYNGPPSTGVFRPHPAQSYEQAAMRRYYGYCDSGPLSGPEQPHSPAPLPPPTSSASITTDGSLPAPDQQAYYPPPSHLPANYDGYYPPGPPPPDMSHGFPSAQQVNGFVPGTPMDVNSAGYYTFPAPMPPHNVYGLIPPHCPQAYYEPPQPVDGVFDGYPPINHSVSAGPEDPNISPPVSHSHPHPPPDAMYYPQYAPYPSHPVGDSLSCAPIGEYQPHHPPISSPDAGTYLPFTDAQKDGSQLAMGHVDGHASSGPSLQAPHESYSTGPGAVLPTNGNGPTLGEPTHTAHVPGQPRLTRGGHHGFSNSRRGQHNGRGGRPMRPRLSGPVGLHFGTYRAQSAGSSPNATSARPQGPPATAPLNASGTSSFPPLASSSPGDERGPRGPCSFFAENRCRFGDECLWAHVMPNGDDAREYRLNYVGPDLVSKDGTLGSEVGFGTKMTRKMDGFDSRAIPGYALWEKRYKEPHRKGAARERSVGGGERVGGKETGSASVDAPNSSRPSMRQKVDELVQQRREGNIPGTQFQSHRMNRGASGGPPRASQPYHSPNGPPHAQLKYLGAPSTRTQRVPSGEDFPALRPNPASAHNTGDKSLGNGLGLSGPDTKEALNDEDASSNSGGTEASASTNATSTKDSPGLVAPKPSMPVIEGGSFAHAAARGASAPAPVKQKPAVAMRPTIAQPLSAPAAPTASLSNGMEEAMKSLEIDSPACQLAASA
ncbi:hypothetical protein CROQUDRAFT_485121 [Cronartium quercuum f. sp. fusiforme G11]|uniref:C3H1-type domain-containing protein n=1 Tax=Cronartium quercuum f. sp. fusiforme G11 TaxID=708437 RepID=A0A9P6TCB1_9BASI|nr:hypothetical protein CROQUDRAFT_485121 [Cronartium quercuum f. sp. fusiforme G11]